MIYVHLVRFWCKFSLLLHSFTISIFFVPANKCQDVAANENMIEKEARLRNLPVGITFHNIIWYTGYSPHENFFH